MTKKKVLKVKIHPQSLCKRQHSEHILNMCLEIKMHNLVVAKGQWLKLRYWISRPLQYSINPAG